VTETCISLVKALKEFVYDGDGTALMAEWRDLTAQDKNDLRDWFIAEGIAIAPIAS
jgi:hypothetical protein